MKLTESIVKTTQYNGGVHKLRDGNGLYLHVMTSGKYWRYDYRYCGKRRTLAVGVWPGVSLKKARLDLFAAKAQLEQGIDPSYDKQLKKDIGGDHSVRAIAQQWMNVQEWSNDHRSTIKNRLEKDLFPRIGTMPVQSVTAADVLGVCRAAESRGAIQTGHRLKTATSQIMRYAVSVGLIDSDPCRDLRGALKSAAVRHYPAITDPVEFGALLRAIDTYDNSPIVAHALQLAPYVALRPSEIRGALWSEIDFSECIWHIGPERMKKKRPHFVPLTGSVISVLNSLKDYTGGHDLLFPSIRTKGRPISDGTLNAALKYLGFSGDRHVPHGFRSTFSTLAYESGLFTEDVIELQLAHLDKNSVKSAYNRSKLLPERIKLMQWWSDEVDAMRTTQPRH